MTTDTTTEARTVQVHRVYIKAPAQKVWDAIVDPSWTTRYGYAAPVEYDLRPGGTFRSTPSDEMRRSAEQYGFTMGDVIVDGEVVEADPPRLLKQTWRMVMDPATLAEGFSTLTYTITEQAGGVCKLTITHDVTGMPALAAMVQGPEADEPDSQGAGGWPWILSDLKSLLETGSTLAG